MLCWPGQQKVGLASKSLCVCEDTCPCGLMTDNPVCLLNSSTESPTSWETLSPGTVCHPIECGGGREEEKREKRDVANIKTLLSGFLTILATHILKSLECGSSADHIYDGCLPISVYLSIKWG